MKKFGFTLSEVLMTLGIIGVVAALTVPSLVKDTSSSKVGPTLAKSVAEWESANQSMLTKMGLDNISNFASDTASYISGEGNLSSYIKLNQIDPYTIKTYTGEEYNNIQNESVFYQSKGGTVYIVDYANNAVWIDVDGQSGKNRMGIDVFRFRLEDNGTLAEYTYYERRIVDGDVQQTNTNWHNRCPDSSGNIDGEFCSGSIMANNWKVVYR